MSTGFNLAQLLGPTLSSQGSSQTAGAASAASPANAFQNIQQTNTSRNDPNKQVKDRVNLFVNAANTNDPSSFISSMIGSMQDTDLTDGQRLLLQSLVIGASGDTRKGFNFAARTLGNKFAGGTGLK